MITTQTPVGAVLKKGECKKSCGHCCTMGAGIVLTEEVGRIAGQLGMPEEEFKKKYLDEFEKFATTHYKLKTAKRGKPYGPCVFYHPEKKCTINSFKPMHCRIGNCGKESAELVKWFEARNFLNKNNPESIRQYSLWLEFNTPLTGASLKELVPDQEKLKKILDYSDLK
jgi:Fe-S-cluster containining protein